MKTGPRPARRVVRRTVQVKGSQPGGGGRGKPSSVPRTMTSLSLCDP